MKRKRYFLIVLILLGIVFLVTGLSYAYFIAAANSEEQVVKSGVLELTYHTGQDISTEGMFPTTEENASTHKFTVENTGTLDAHYNISFIDIALTKGGMDVTSFNLKWALYLADSDYTEGDPVKEGSFSPSSGYVSGDDEFVIKTNMILAPEEKQSFILKVWLEETGKPQNEDQGLNLAMKMQVDTLDKQETASKQSVMRERNDQWSNETFYEYDNSITKIVFQNKMNPIPEAAYSWDVSENNDGNCMAYLVSNGEETDPTYTLYIQGNDEIYLSSGRYMLFRFSSLETIEGMEYVKGSQMTDMSDMFEECSLTSLDLSHLGTNQVKSMERMFSECNELVSLNLDNFDTSHVTDMSYMFIGCYNLLGLDVSSFNTSQVTDMSYMFSGNSNKSLAPDSKLAEIIGLENFDTSQVTNMSGMFSECFSLTSLDLSSFDTSKVTDMSEMFSGKTTDNYYEPYMQLTQIKGIENFDTSQVINMNYMFNRCGSLTSLDLSHFDTSQVTSMGAMFNRCRGLSYLNVNSFDTSQVIDMRMMFAGCSSLINLDVSHLNTSKVVDMWRMFAECSSLTSLDVSHLDTSQVTNMNEMFNDCSSLTSLNVSNFDTSKVKDMMLMFADCSKLTSLDVSNFDTSQVTNMWWMFAGCRSLINLDFRNATFTTVTSYSDMFSSVPSTIQIIVKDTTAQSWMQERLGSGKGTVIIA